MALVKYLCEHGNEYVNERTKERRNEGTNEHCDKKGMFHSSWVLPNDTIRCVTIYGAPY